MVSYARHDSCQVYFTSFQICSFVFHSIQFVCAKTTIHGDAKKCSHIVVLWQLSKVPLN